MLRTLVFLVAVAGMILVPDIRAHESVCDLFSHLESSDAQQIVVTGDLVISKDVTILGAADCDCQYTSALSGIQRVWQAALSLHASAAVTPGQLRQVQQPGRLYDAFCRRKTHSPIKKGAGKVSGAYEIRLARCGLARRQNLLQSYLLSATPGDGAPKSRRLLAAARAPRADG